MKKCEIFFPQVHDGIQLSNNKFYAVDSGYTTTDDLTATSVRIKELGQRQLGDYHCRAQNKLGSGEKTITVEQSYQPNCLGLCGGEFTGSATTLAAPLCQVLAVASLARLVL